MGEDNGVEKKGKIVDLSKKRAERGLPEVTAEDAERTFVEAAQNCIQRVERDHADKQAVLDSFGKGGKDLDEGEIMDIMTDLAMGRTTRYSEWVRYSAAKEYIRRRNDRLQQNVDK